MADARPEFNFRINELVPLARLLRTSYVRDQPAFANLLPAVYTDAFLTGYDQRTAAAEAVVRSSVAIAQRQLITQRLAGQLDALPVLLDHLEARLRRAAPLTVPIKAFGLEAVRRARNQADHEGLTGALTTLLQNIAANEPALAAQGQPAAETAQLQALHDGIAADRTAQGSGFSTQYLLTDDTIATLNALYADMAHLLADGKSLYQRADKTRAKDYTLAQVLKRVRRDQPAPPPAEGPQPA